MLTFETFIGQEALKEEFRRLFLAARTGSPIPHVLLSGPPEMGKVTFAKAVAAELRVGVYTPGPIAVKLDWIGIACNVQENEIVVLSDIEMLKCDVADLVATALSDRHMDVSIGDRIVGMDVRPFSLIGTTSKPWAIPARFRRWFVVMDFRPYSVEEMARLVSQLAMPRGIQIDVAAGAVLANVCKGIPGNALALLKRIEQHYKPFTSAPITSEVAQHLLDLLGYSRTDQLSVTLADQLRVMSGLDFERFVADIFNRAGYATELTPGSGDHGIDILIRKGNQSGAVQCKRWAGTVGEPVVRDFLGSTTGAGLQLGFVVTAGAFTDSATAFARANGIRLLDLGAILEIATVAAPVL